MRNINQKSRVLTKQEVPHEVREQFKALLKTMGEPSEMAYEPFFFPELRISP